MALNVQQGPRSPSVLFMAGEHRADDVFINGEDEIFPMIVRRGDGTFWDIIARHLIPPRVLRILTRAGFMGVLDCGHRNIDRALIHALVERWRPETNTFHLPFGEATVTLEDVNVLYGLPVEGNAVSGIARKPQYYISKCRGLLGFEPQESDLKGGRLKVSTLYQHLQNDVDVLDINECNIRARIIILCLLAGTILPDSGAGTVPLTYLSHLEDLTVCGGLSWGSAALACLYRNLYKAAIVTCHEISGPMYLLQLWAWERIKVLSPTLPAGEHEIYTALGTRWRQAIIVVETATHVLKSYRSQLQVLRENMFIWRPYRGRDLPATCTNGRASWRSRCPLILWDFVELHLPDRVLKQFGLRQVIPANVPMLVEEHRRLHQLQRTGRRETNWLTFHEDYISIWDSRHTQIVPGDETENPESDGDYLGWYLRHTVTHIANPTLALGSRSGYQNVGAVNSFMADGFAYAYQGPIENARERISQVMQVANQQHWLDFPTSLTTQPVEPIGVGNAPQIARGHRNRRRRGRQVGVQDVEEGTPSYEQWGTPSYGQSTPGWRHSTESPVHSTESFGDAIPSYGQSPPRFTQHSQYEVGGSSQNFGLGNYEEPATSYNQPDTMAYGGGFFPSGQHVFSPAPSYTSFGGPPISYTPMPMPPHFSQDDSAPNLFAGVSSEVVPPRFSNVTPLPLNFPDDERDGRRQSQREPQPTRCFTGGLLFPHHDHDQEQGHGRRRGRRGGN